jgi:Putative DNA-binding domain
VPALTSAQVRDLLEARDFEALVGAIEADDVEFKHSPYRLDERAQKLELAKDVAAMANRGGGIIVLGVKTSQATQSNVTEATGIRPFDPTLLNSTQYTDTFAGYIHPIPSGVTITFRRASPEEPAGIADIDIPAPHDEDLPLLVKGGLVDGAGDPVGWLIGVPTRRGDQTRHQTIQEIHHQIRNGSRPGGSEILTAVERLTEAVNNLRGDAADDTRRPSATEPPGEKALRRVEDLVREHAAPGALDEAIDTSMPHLVIAAASDDGAIHSFLGGGRALLEQPPHSRHTGWNLVTLDQALQIQANVLRVRNGDRKRVDLVRDGGLLALVALPGFLARGSTIEPWTINPLALIEFTHDFLLTYAEVSRRIDPAPTAVGIHFELRSLHWGVDGEYTMRLSPYHLESGQSMIPLRAGAPSSDYLWVDQAPVHPAAGERIAIGSVAYDVVAAFYRWWGTDAEVPYAEQGVVSARLFPLSTPGIIG